MKKSLIIMILLVVLSSVCFCSGHKEEKLVVYCYDSFTGDWGAGNGIVKAFKEKTGIDVELVGCGGALETYSKVIYEGSSCKADVVLGLSDATNVDKTLFDTYEAFDYGIFAFVFDTESQTQAPKSLEDLTKPKYKNKVVLIDPRTSSVGLGLLKWTISAMGEQRAYQWWKSMKDNALTIASSWSMAYGLFSEGEVDLAISYTTSPVYHVMYENTTRYQALEFSDGHVKTTEFIGILNSSKKKKEARLFVDFVLNEGQSEIAVVNSLFPVNSKTELPDAYKWAIKPKMLKEDDSFTSKENYYLDKWTSEMVR